MFTIGLNRARVEQVADHLWKCDSDFSPPLSERVSIDAYSSKIVDYATRFEAWDDGELVGLVAAYVGESPQRELFITNVSSLPARRGQGIASSLLNTCIEFCVRGGYVGIRLEVSATNAAARSLYKKLGFQEISRGAGNVEMRWINSRGVNNVEQ